MQQTLYQHLKFEKELSQCNNINQVPNLIEEIPNKNAQVALKSCCKTINLTRNVFHRLLLKESNIITKDTILENNTDFRVELDSEMHGDEGSKELKDLRLLQQFLKYSCKEGTVFFHTKMWQRIMLYLWSNQGTTRGI